MPMGHGVREAAQKSCHWKICPYAGRACHEERVDWQVPAMSAKAYFLALRELQSGEFEALKVEAPVDCWTYLSSRVRGSIFASTASAPGDAPGYQLLSLAAPAAVLNPSPVDAAGDTLQQSSR